MISSNKRGWAMDLIYVCVALFVIVIAIYVSGVLFNELKDSGLFEKSSIGAEMRDNYQTLYNLYDYIFVFIIVALAIGLTLVGYYVDLPLPVLLVLFFVWIVALILTPALSNVFDEMVLTDEFQEVNNDYRFIPHFMNKMPIVISVLGFLFMVSIGLKNYYRGY